MFELIYFNGCSFTAGGGLEVPNPGENAVFAHTGYKSLSI